MTLFNIPLLEFIDQIIQQLKVLILNQIAQTVADFSIPYMQPISVKAQPRKMIDITVYGLPVTLSGTLDSAVGMSKGRGIIDPQIGPSHFSNRLDAR